MLETTADLSIQDSEFFLEEQPYCLRSETLERGWVHPGEPKFLSFESQRLLLQKDKEEGRSQAELPPP